MMWEDLFLMKSKVYRPIMVWFWFGMLTIFSLFGFFIIDYWQKYVLPPLALAMVWGLILSLRYYILFEEDRIRMRYPVLVTGRSLWKGSTLEFHEILYRDIQTIELTHSFVGGSRVYITLLDGRMLSFATSDFFERSKIKAHFCEVQLILKKTRSESTT